MPNAFLTAQAIETILKFYDEIFVDEADDSHSPPDADAGDYTDQEKLGEQYPEGVTDWLGEGQDVNALEGGSRKESVPLGNGLMV